MALPVLLRCRFNLRERCRSRLQITPLLWSRLSSSGRSRSVMLILGSLISVLAKHIVIYCGSANHSVERWRGRANALKGMR